MASPFQLSYKKVLPIPFAWHRCVGSPGIGWKLITLRANGQTYAQIEYSCKKSFLLSVMFKTHLGFEAMRKRSLIESLETPNEIHRKIKDRSFESTGTASLTSKFTKSDFSVRSNLGSDTNCPKWCVMTNHPKNMSSILTL